jgi:hypothetical protein
MPAIQNGVILRAAMQTPYEDPQRTAATETKKHADIP